MLRGELAGKDLEEFVEERLVFTRFETAQNWARNAIFPLGFGPACCAIEMITVVGHPATTWPASAPRRSASRRARPTC